MTCPAAGAVQRHHTDLPPGCPAWFGSPGSLLAPTLVPTVFPEENPRAAALMNLSLSGTGTLTVIPSARVVSPLWVVLLTKFAVEP